MFFKDLFSKYILRRGCVYVVVIVTEGLEVLLHSGNLSFAKRPLVGWLDVWELNSEDLGSLWLMTSVIRDCCKQDVPLF